MPLEIRKRRSLLVAAAIPTFLAVALTSCATADQETAPAEQAAGNSEVSLDQDLYVAAVAKATEVAGTDDLGDSLEVIAGNTGYEGAIMEAVFAAFTEGTGTAVEYTGTGSGAATNSAVQSRVQGGNAPDIAEMNLGVARGYAESGDLLDLTETIGADELAANYSTALLDAASSDGAVFGVYQGFSNFPFWYNPKEYTGPVDTTDWADVVDWTTAEAAEGTPVWCLGLEAGAGSGFPGAQFIEVLFAKKYGPELLEQWGSGELSWTSAEVKDAFEMFGQVAADDSVYGGIAGALSQSVTDGPLGLVSDPVTCQADIWGSWVPGVIGADAVPEENIDFMPVPGSVPEYAATEIFQAPVYTAFSDTDQAKAFMKFLASEEAQALLASANQWTVSNVNVSTDTYGSPLLQKAASYYFSDDVTLATGPNVLANAAVGDAFNKAVVAYLQNPADLDGILATVQTAAE